MARPTGRPVRSELLAAGRESMQRSGISGLSYGRLATKLGIKAPSIHHHFKRKDDLIAAAIAEYRQSFNDWASEIDNPSPLDRIRTYARRYAETAADDLLCLCGAAAAEWPALSSAAQAEVAEFFDDQVAWLVAQLKSAAESGEVEPSAANDATARALLAALEGSMLLSRTGTSSALAIDSVDLMLRHLGPA